MGKIYFQKEAKEWNQAFPVGNGFLGAMVFGNVAKERIQVNEDSVWSGGFSDRVNPDAGKCLEKIREYLFAGKVQEAEKLAEQSMYATSPNMRVYQPLGDIWIRFLDQEAERKLVRDERRLPYLKECAAKVEAYQRTLDLEQAVGKITYSVENKTWNREFFVSNPAQAGMYSICAEGGEDINLEISATRKDNRSGRGVSFCDQIQAEQNQYIWLEGTSGGSDGIGFVMGVRVFPAEASNIRWEAVSLWKRLKKFSVVLREEQHSVRKNQRNGAENIWKKFVWIRMMKEEKNIFRIIRTIFMPVVSRSGIRRLWII